MAVKPPKPLFGRKKDIQYLCNIVNQNKNRVTCLIGEASVGKSVLLEEVYSNLQRLNPELLLGFYRQHSRLYGESQSSIYPFITILEDLIVSAKNIESEYFKKRTDHTISELIKTVKNIAPDLVSAFVGDMASKLGFEKTVGVITDRIKRGSQSPIREAKDYASEHSGEAVFSYIKVIDSLLKEFTDRRLVLIFDQFETVRMASVDFIINLITHMPEDSKLHVILSFSVEEKKSSEKTGRELFNYFNEYLESIDLKPYKLGGLEEEGIREWLEYEGKYNDKDESKLTLIKQESAGFPIVLEEWISTYEPNNFDLSNLNIGMLCPNVHKRREALRSNAYRNALDRLVILAQSQSKNPMTIKQLTGHPAYTDFIGIKPDDYLDFRNELLKLGIFETYEEDYAWFKHDVIQKYLEKFLHQADNIVSYQDNQIKAVNLIQIILGENQNRYGN